MRRQTTVGALGKGHPPRCIPMMGVFERLFMTTSPHHTRRIRITFRISAAEHAAAKAAAERAAISLSSYIRQVLFQAEPPRAARRPPVETSLVATLIQTIGAVSDPLQRLAHKAAEAPADVAMLPVIERELLRTLRQLRDVRAMGLKALGRNDLRA